jgi:hypothetical protein
MRKRKPKLTPAETEAIQNFRQLPIDAAVALCKDRMTFMELADFLHVGHEFVRSRLVQTPRSLFLVGRQYQVPHAVAVEFVKTTLSTGRGVRRNLSTRWCRQKFGSRLAEQADAENGFGFQALGYRH